MLIPNICEGQATQNWQDNEKEGRTVLSHGPEIPSINSFTYLNIIIE
jgi:hypothetical protein